MKKLLLLICLSTFLFSNGIFSQDFGAESLRWKHKTDITTLGMTGVGNFWNIKKVDDSTWEMGLGFRLDVGTNFATLGPAFDIHRILDRGKVSPLFGLQVGMGGAFYTVDVIEFLDFYYNIIPYVGVNVKLNSRIEVEAGMQVRYTASYDFENFFVAPVFLAIKF